MIFNASDFSFCCASTDSFVISSNIWTFYFPELKNLNFGHWNLLRNWSLIIARAALKITKIQMFMFGKIKGSYVWGYIWQMHQYFVKKLPLSRDKRLGFAKSLWNFPFRISIEIKNNKARHEIRILNTVRWP